MEFCTLRYCFVTSRAEVPTFNCCYYCDGGQVYIGDVLEQEPASIKIDGNTMTISECPAAELIRFDETVAEILFPLVLEKQQ